MKRRFQTHFKTNSDARGLQPDNPAAREGRTIFPSTVVHPTDSRRILISGVNQRKIGGEVVKGRWRGMPIFCVTLEERATCPESCHHWLDCYGNNMHMARRHQHGAALEAALAAELADKQREHPAGFVVRLHILGDFYDEAYVMLWRRWMTQFPALRIFGYTARPFETVIGRLVDTMNADFGDRAYIRFSRTEAAAGVINAITIPDADFTTDAIICPAQTGKSACCGTCGLCWSTDKTIAFLQHGRSYDWRKRKDTDAPDGGLTVTKMAAEPMSAAAPEPHISKAADPSVPAQWSGKAFLPDKPAAPGMVDRKQSVPARAIEVRAWLSQIIRTWEDMPTDATLFRVANHHRARFGLPPFRAIRERENSGRYETIMVSA